LSGDLVRIGQWTERAHARRAPQAVVTVESNQAAVVQGRSPDIAVLGDSFSMGNVWQSVLMQHTGLLTRSWSFGGHGCIDEFLRSLPAGTKEVVIQTIERHLLDRFEQPAPCAPPGLQAFEGPPGVTEREHTSGRLSLDARYLFNSLRNHFRVRGNPVARIASGDTLSVHLKRSDLFSSRLPQRLLYFLGDDFKEGWTAERVNRAAEQASQWQAMMDARGLRLTLLVVPDKSSVYRSVVQPPLPPHGQPEFARRFAQSGVRIVWPLEEFQAIALAAHPQPDLYLPNDTHLSPGGFALLGGIMSRYFSAPTAVRP
jgi:hypothetical protein